MKTQQLKMRGRKLGLLSLSIAMAFLASCSNSEKPEENASEQSTETAKEAPVVNTDPMKNKGIGPITSVEITALNNALAEKGKGVFEKKCSSCHKFDVRYVGPPLKGVTTRRTPEWIMNQILNPLEMEQKDPIGKELLATFMTQMTFQNVTQDEARAILEYFRKTDSQ